MIFGVDYYPEQWEKSEWEAQADLMKDGGFNTVRMGEFAWKLFEPEEGRYDFTFLDQVIEILAKRDIKVILGTPTAAPPKWLVNKYDVLLRDRYGRKRSWGSRRECCANSREYKDLSVKIITEMAEHYKNHPSIIGWQIDNEFGCHNSTRCYCENCRREFGSWLKKKYVTIENLNKTWGTEFWSLGFESFDDIILPGYNACEGETSGNPAHNPSLELEYRRFASDSWVEYEQLQIDCIRKYSDAPITHNLMGHFSDIDYYRLSEKLDFVSWDNYPSNQWGSPEALWHGMAHEIMYGTKGKSFIVMEQQAGPCGWEKIGKAPKPGQLRLWTYQSIAHGAEGIVYFRFRTALYGMEQYWYGVLDHDGKPRRRFYELTQTGKELKSLGEEITAGQRKYEVMIYRSFDDLWSQEIKPHYDGINFEDELYNCFRANEQLGITPAVSCRNLSDYKVVYFPMHNIVSEEMAEEIDTYVSNGGVAVFTYRSGLRDEYNVIRPLAVPGLFLGLTGAEAEEFDTAEEGVAVTGLAEGKAKGWCDILTTDGADALMTYAEGYYAGKAAVTRNYYGKGTVYYIGCQLDEASLKEVVREISRCHGITMYDLPENVERVEKGDCIFYLNHNEYPVNISADGISVLTGKTFDGRLEGYGVEVVRIN